MRRLLIPLLVVLSCGAARGLPAVQDGDIIFHTSQSSQSIDIQRATGSSYSHMGLILFRNGKPYVFEAISTVRYTPFARWIARGNDRHFVVKRLKDAARVRPAPRGSTSNRSSPAPSGTVSWKPAKPWPPPCAAPATRGLSGSAPGKYRQESGEEILHPLGEINARMTFGPVAWTLAERVAGAALLLFGRNLPVPEPGAAVEILLSRAREAGGRRGWGS